MPTIITKETVFPKPGEEKPKGVITVEKWKIKEDDGSEREQFIWPRGKFVVVVVIDDQERLVLKREMKYAHLQPLLTCVAGAIQKGETSLDAAKRELKEELGMQSTASAWRMICENMTSSPDKSTELHDIWLAQSATVINNAIPEPGEILRFQKKDAWNAWWGCNIAIQRLAIIESLHRMVWLPFLKR